MVNLQEIEVFVTYNPLDADEFVWIDTDVEKLDALLVSKTTPYNKQNPKELITIVYLVNKTSELETLYQRLSADEFKKIDMRGLKKFDLWNSCVPRITLIAGWVGTK